MEGESQNTMGRRQRSSAAFIALEAGPAKIISSHNSPSENQSRTTTWRRAAPARPIGSALTCGRTRQERTRRQHVMPSSAVTCSRRVLPLRAIGDRLTRGSQGAVAVHFIACRARD